MLHFLTITTVAYFFGLALIVYGAFYIIALFFPPLSRRVHGKLSPFCFNDQPKRRGAWITAFGKGALYFILGLNSFALQLPKQSCFFATRPLLSVTLPFMLIVCLLLLFGISRHTGFADFDQRVSLGPEAEAKARKILRYVLLSLIVLSIGFFWFVAPLFGSSFSFTSLNSIRMVSRDEGWAVGSQDLRGAIYHYRRGVWTKQNVSIRESVTNLDMVSPDEGWAITSGTVLLHYQHGAWIPLSLPNNAYLQSINMLSVSEGWAVGDGGTTLHYTSGRWLQVASPVSETLKSVAMVSPNEGWAVGGDTLSGRTASVLLHYTGGRWKLADNPTTMPLNDIAMINANEGWAVGGTERGSYPVHSVILHYRAGTWTPVEVPSSLPLKRVAVLPDGQAWAVGGGYFSVPLDCAEEPSQSAQINAIVHYDGAHWQAIDAPNDKELNDIAMLAPNEGWIVGRNMILRYDGSLWSEALSLK